MRALALTVGALAVVGLMGVLAFWAAVDGPSPTAPGEPGSAGVAASGEHAAAPSGERGDDRRSTGGPEAPAGDAEPSADAAPSSDATPGADTAPGARPSAGVPGAGTGSQNDLDPKQAFRSRVDGLLAKGDKAAFAELLDGWRTGALSREQERVIDEALASVEGDQLDELDTAVGRLLLEVPAQPERRRALASLLASSGSQHGIRYLIEAAAKPELQAQALRTLGTVSDPEVLPVYRQQINGSASPDLLNAIASSLRQMDTPKARELERKLEALR